MNIIPYLFSYFNDKFVQIYHIRFVHSEHSKKFKLFKASDVFSSKAFFADKASYYAGSLFLALGAEYKVLHRNTVRSEKLGAVAHIYRQGIE